MDHVAAGHPHSQTVPVRRLENSRAVPVFSVPDESRVETQLAETREVLLQTPLWVLLA